MRNIDYERAIEVIAERYEEAKEEEFNDDFREWMSNQETVDKDDIQGFLDIWTFPSEIDWCEEQFNDERSAYEDAKYQEMKEEGIM